MTTRVAILGCGNMGSAMAQGLLRDASLELSLIVADPNLQKLERLTETAATTTTDSTVAVQRTDIVILAVKPYAAQAALEGCADHLNDKLIISVMAGIPMVRLANWLPPATPIVRCMPNTPSVVGAGITGVIGNAFVDTSHIELVASLLQSLGNVLWLTSEDQLHAVTALSGCGPAYYFYIMEAMVEAGMNLALDREVVEKLVVQTAFGAAKLARDTQITPQTLKRQVATPGGTAAAALNSLNKDKVGTAITAAIEVARDRSVKIGEEF